MKIVITGSTGMLGRALVERLRLSHEVVGVARHAASVGGNPRQVACDLSRPEAADALCALAPAVIVHAAAMSDVDGCERQPEDARRGNVAATERVVESALRSRAYLIAISTDYVFDGTKGAPYTEEDAPHPLSVYGRSKWEGEERVRRLPGRWAILRTSTLFGPGRPGFIDRVAACARRGEPVSAFRDQATSPTYAPDLADAVARLIERMGGEALPSGLFHLTNAGWCTRLQFAQHVLSVLGYASSLARPAALAEAALPAPRPPMAALDNTRWKETFGWQLRPWQDAVKQHLAWAPTPSRP